ncbi:MAG TPA: hypothetical protein VMX97_12260 [Hyphomicrobiaceae bacterium]|nr:hypothetical protein [Hyphomicrobiaceae bacterium]
MGVLTADGGNKSTSSLNTVHNDTGRIAFCGPYVISAITGWSISKIEARINAYRDLPPGQKPVVKGTYDDEVQATLATFGYRMQLRESFLGLERRERPTLWSWMQKPRNAWSYYILSVHKGREGHWILIKGVKLCDTFSEGKWQFVCDGPHRGARIMDVFEVKRELSV